MKRQDIIFPRLNSFQSEGEQDFMRAYAMDVLMDIKPEKYDIVEIVHGYWDAFLDGNTDAGANVLRILTMTAYNAREDRGSAKALFDKMDYIRTRLSELNHPIVPYYEALVACSTEDDADVGMDMMEKLAEEGNPFAYNYIVLLMCESDGGDADLPHA